MPRTTRTRPCAGPAAAAALAAASLALSACTHDPFERPGTLAPQGYNDANLRAMIVDSAHLRHGADAPLTRSDAAAKPVDLLRSGKRAPLPAVSTAGR